MQYIGIDIGTSFIKGAVLELNNYSLHSIRRQPFPEARADVAAPLYEVEPQAIVRAVGLLLDSLLVDAPQCQGVILCSQMHGLVLMDRAGQALSNAITWRDQRALQTHPSGETWFDAMMAQIDRSQRQELGNGLRPGLPICTLFWLREHNALPAAAIPATLPDYVVANLCQDVRLGVEPTNAAAHGAYNVTTGDWHWDVLKQLGLDALEWPSIRAVNTVVGTLLAGGREIPCFAPVGDHQCSLAGTFLESGELSLNISTGSQVSLVTPELRMGNYEIRPYFDGLYLNTLVQIPAGRALDSLVALLTELARRSNVELPSPWEIISQAVDEVAESDLDVNLAFFSSMLGDQGHIANAREDNLTVGHLFRAAYQSMAENYLTCALRLSPHQEWSQLVFSGGLVQKQTALRMLIQQQFESDYRLCASSEDALLGLLSLALFTSGRANSVQESAEMLRKANM